MTSTQRHTGYDAVSIETLSLLRRPAYLPSTLHVPLKGAWGETAQAQVQVGDYVYKGQCLASANGWVSVAVHAPTSGWVSAIESAAHSTLATTICVDSDAKEQWGERPYINAALADLATTRNYLQQSGVVGMNGLPIHLSLQANRWHSLLINAVHTDPSVGIDHVVDDDAEILVHTALHLTHLLGVKRCILALGEQQIVALRQWQQAAAGTLLAIETVPNRYPNHHPRILLTKLLQKRLAPQQRLSHLGVLHLTLPTLQAIAHALWQQWPLISRKLTISGQVKSPGYYSVFVGTPLTALLAHHGAQTDECTVFAGSRIAGYPLSCDYSDKQLHALAVMALPKNEAAPCIRCQRCTEVCPLQLQPYDLYRLISCGQYQRAQQRQLMACIACGACEPVCPSHLPLQQQLRHGQQRLVLERQQQQRIAHARRHYQQHQARCQAQMLEKAQGLTLPITQAKQVMPLKGELEDNAARQTRLLAAQRRAVAKRREQQVKSRATHES